MADDETTEEFTVATSEDDGFVSFVAEEMAAYNRDLAAEMHEVMPRGMTLAKEFDFYYTRIYRVWDQMRHSLKLGDKDSTERAHKVDALGAEMGAYLHAISLTEQATQAAISELFWLRDRQESLEGAGAFDAAIDILVNRFGGERRS